MSITRKQTRSLLYLEEMKQNAIGAWRDAINSIKFPHTSEGAYYGNSRIEPITGEAGNLGAITVTGSKAARKKPYFVASRTGQLTAGDAAKALDAMVTPALSWATPNPFRAIEGLLTGDIDKTALEGLKLLGLKGIGTLAANTTRTGLTNGINTVRLALMNPATTLNSAKAAISTAGKNIITPGSSFWTNPLTKRMMTGTALAKGFDAASTAVGYNSWGLGISDVIHKTTGWNPLTSYTGQFLTEGLNPGWWIDPTKVEPVVGTIGRGIENGVKSIYRAVRPEPKSYLENFDRNAMYRIIGDEGYLDAILNSVLRPNMNPNSRHYRSTNKNLNFFTKGHPNDKNHPVIYPNGRMPADAVYPGDVIVEVSPQHPQFSAFLPHRPEVGIFKTAGDENFINTNSPFVNFFRRDKKGRYFKIDNPTYTPGEFPQGLTNNEPLIARGIDNDIKNINSLIKISELPNSRLSTTVKSLQLTDPRNFITNSVDEDGMLRISFDKLQELAELRLGRKLTNTEIEDFIGRTRDPFVDDGTIPNFWDVDNLGHKVGIDFDENYLDEALLNFDKFVNPKTIRTRYGNETPYELDELVANKATDGTYRLKPDVSLQRTYAGEHGGTNWFLNRDDIITRARKYVATKYNPNRFKIGKKIVDENPYDRSGVIVRGGDSDFSIDSFESALNYIMKALRKGRRFVPLRGNNITYKVDKGKIVQIPTIKSNNFGQIKRYNEEFSDELVDAIKLNNGTLPDYIRALDDYNITIGPDGNRNVTNYISLKDGNREVGRLIKRSDKDIVEEYKRMIDNLNETYNLKIGYPEIKDVVIGAPGNTRSIKKIFWPNIYGLLYKKGGKLNK